MDLGHTALLVLAGLLAGGINALAGGGSLITFPSLIATGLPSVDANVTNSVSVFPGYVSSVVGSRADLAGQSARLKLVLPAAVLGGIGGCALLLLTPQRAFDVIVPFLVLAAAATLAFQERLRGLVGRQRVTNTRALLAVVFVGAIYGGYFGAALGVMYVAALALVLDEKLNTINALKNVLSAVVGLVTLVVFAIFAPIHWGAALTLAPATIVGGYAGARLARRLPSRVLKWIIVTFGTVIGLILLIRAFN